MMNLEKFQNIEKQNPQIWSRDEMSDAIKIFYDTGDYNQCLSLINADTDPLFAIQHALGIATCRIERDAFEDISFEICNRGYMAGVSHKYLHKIIKGINDEYGSLAVELLETRFPLLVSGILKGLKSIPPVNCIVALMGIEAQKMSDMTIIADADKFGKSFNYYSVKCEICGGKDGGAGHVFCRNCLAEVQNKFSQVGDLLKLFDHKNLEDSELFARDILISESDRFGCSECGYQPVKTCECAKEIAIPKNPSDGEIIRGKYSLTNKDWLCCIRHK